METGIFDKRAVKLLERLNEADSERQYGAILVSMERFMKLNSPKLNQETHSLFARKMAEIVKDDLNSFSRRRKAISIIVAMGGSQAILVLKGLVKSAWAQGLFDDLAGALHTLCS
jgi:hypothetical protein